MAPEAIRDPRSILGSRRLVLISNREPYFRSKSPEGEPTWQVSGGGLVTALDPVMRACRGVWLAWDPDSQAGGERVRHRVPDEGPQFTMTKVPLSAGEVRGYYFGLANRALWPLFHYFVDRCNFDEKEWADYVRVNARFADAVVEETLDDDFVWVHDYHFCLLPKMIRERRHTRGPISYFHHTPFPSKEIFRIFPWRRELLAGMLGADLVGFHTPRYAKSFLESCQTILNADVDTSAGRVRWDGRTVSVGAFPIGIDSESFEATARREDTRERAQVIRRNIGTEKVILGVDRLDYSKGIPLRLAAIDRLFDRHPEHLGKVTFVQVAVPSRTKVKEYSELKRDIDETIGRINGRFSNTGWAPIIYIYGSLERDELVAYYLASNVALVTPLRDGMNLVAKEYCAAHYEGDGVLLLSELTGAADGMADGAVLVNPFSVEDVSTALDFALTMDPQERKRRMEACRAVVNDTDIHRWLDSVLDATLSATSS